MEQVIITRKFEFDSAHRVLNHESKCRHLHGHRYVAECSFSAPELDELGRVIDFSVIKTTVGRWIDEMWDHNIILHPDDPLTKLWENSRDRLDPKEREGLASIFGGKDPYIMPYRRPNPTVENLIAVLFDELSCIFDGDIRLEGIRLYETPNCWADYPMETSQGQAHPIIEME